MPLGHIFEQSVGLSMTYIYINGWPSRLTQLYIE